MVQMNPLDMAKTVLGRTEGRDRAVLIEYLKRGGQNLDPATRAWCASFINASLEMAGYSGTGSDLAKSFATWGQAVEPDQLQPGDVAVYNRGSDPTYGHAGMVESYDPKTGMVTLISGNAEGGAGGEDAVMRQQRKVTEAIAYRRAEAVQAAGGSPEQVRKAFLDTIAGPESGGQYDVYYGGGKFKDFSQHPNIRVPIQKGPNAGDYSTAAGRYQFIKGTWDEQQKKYGYKDFSPENQDLAAWNYANDTYKAKTGQGLEEALASNDPARINAAADILKGLWTSMPGGIEQQGYGGGTFAEAFQKNLGATPQAGHPTTTVGAPGTAPAAAPVTTSDKKDGWWKKFGKGLTENMPTATASGATPTGITDTPRAVLAPATPTTFDSGGQEAELRRQNLAQIMARLNSQKLWG